MKIILKRAIQNSHGRFFSGDVVDWPPHDTKPLLELGYAVDFEREATYASKPAVDLAEEYDLEPAGGKGSGKNGAYTIADLRDIIEGEEE
jgi:hypothetical protein